ncbi:MAG: replicative DNA helicase [Clostridia bacterium]|nr:replicative DNA helicase [Clostridia bacterium]
MPTKKITGDMPHNVEAEQALLGCLLLDQEVQTEIFSKLKVEDFYSEANRYVFSAMDKLSKENKLIDLVTISDVLEKEGNLEAAGGINYLTDLADVMASTANYSEYLDIVKRDSVLRKLISSASEIINDCRKSKDMSSSLAIAEKKIYDISTATDSGKLVRIDSVIPEVLMRVELASSDKSALRGIRTGYKGLDSLTDGLHKSDLIILAARPSVGKTSFAMNIVGNVALQGYTCAVFSLEMSKEQIVQRLMCSIADVSMSNASRGEMTNEEWMRFLRAREILGKSKIFIDESGMSTPREILSQCRRLKAKHGLDLIMIDYIQLMDSGLGGKEESRQREITEISRRLKLIAKELNVPVIALSQLSRAVETRKGVPQLSDLRESGAIEQDADIVMFIHRPDKGADQADLDSGKVKKNVAQIVLAKQRNGATGTVELYFDGERTKFLNLDPDTGEVSEIDIKQFALAKPEPQKAKQEEKENGNSDDELFG